ncbi:hypothetical protein BGZ92_003986, partial [Podila epicladia]
MADYEKMLSDANHPGWRNLEAKEFDPATLCAWLKFAREHDADKEESMSAQGFKWKRKWNPPLPNPHIGDGFRIGIDTPAGGF